jgi:hypothetical protein
MKYPNAIIHPEGSLRPEIRARVRELKVDSDFVAINQDEAAGVVLQIIIDASGLRDMFPLPDIAPWVQLQDGDFVERSCLFLLAPNLFPAIDLLKENGFIEQRPIHGRLREYRLCPKAVNSALAKIQKASSSVRGHVH